MTEQSDQQTDQLAERLTDQLRVMWRIRAFEERTRELKLAGEIAGSVHLCIGQEAIPVGALSSLDRSVDTVFATYRGHGYAIACGSDLTQLFAELLGRSTGINGGRGGSAYLSDPDHGFFGENSIVGAGAPHAVGAALAGRYDGSGRVALTAFGDGAMNQGAVHEAMNMAGAFRLPVVFLLENNRYSELTPIAAMVGDPELHRRASAYGFEGHRVDGNDPTAVAEAVAYARRRAADGEGPTLVEAMTERLVGHYVGDVEQYRPAGEIDDAQTREPLVVGMRRLAKLGRPHEELRRIEEDERRLVQLAAETAMAAPLADPHTALEFLYA
jgi:pyruvate dehydrogenase E1 component alpha subunit